MQGPRTFPAPAALAGTEQQLLQQQQLHLQQQQQQQQQATLQGQLGLSAQQQQQGLESMSDDSDALSQDSDDLSWIAWFCALRGNEFFTEIDEDYIQDDFNLTGLAALVPNYEYALDMILDADDDLTREQQEIVESAAERLYGLIHARFVITARGVQNMVEKYKAVEFGRCPRVFCQGQPVLPVGQSDVPQTHTVKLFCPRCQDVYFPKNARHQQLDGAYWGTTFPHMLLQSHPELVPTLPERKYVPRIYGFRINERAANWPRPSRAAVERSGELGPR